MTTARFKHISVGNDGRVWATGAADDTIYRLYDDAGYLGWSPNKVGKAEIIAAVNWGNAWCINQAGEIWQLADADMVGTSGTWTHVQDYGNASDARAISVGSDGSVWYARGSDGNLFHREENRWRRNPCFAIDVAAVNQDDVWCISTSGEILHLANTDGVDGEHWVQVPTYRGRADAKSISAGVDGSVWYVDINGAVYFWQMIAEAWDRGWDQGQMGSVNVIAVRTQGEVWCLNRAGEVWRTFDTSPHDNQWHQVVEIGPSDENSNMTYTVQPGDNLWTIVRRVKWSHRARG